MLTLEDILTLDIDKLQTRFYTNFSKKVDPIIKSKTGCRPVTFNTKDKWCSSCRKYLPYTEFYRNKLRSTGVETYCKPCGKVRESKRKPRRKSKEQAKKHKLKSLYNLSKEEYNFLIALRGNTCVICDSNSSKMVLDHNHKTGQARDYICQRCNLLIGLIETKEGIIPKIINYIQFNDKNPRWYDKMMIKR